MRFLSRTIVLKSQSFSTSTTTHIVCFMLLYFGTLYICPSHLLTFLSTEVITDVLLTTKHLSECIFGTTGHIVWPISTNLSALQRLGTHCSKAINNNCKMYVYFSRRVFDQTTQHMLHEKITFMYIIIPKIQQNMLLQAYHKVHTFGQQ